MTALRKAFVDHPFNTGLGISAVLAVTSALVLGGVIFILQYIPNI